MQPAPLPLIAPGFVGLPPPVWMYYYIISSMMDRIPQQLFIRGPTDVIIQPFAAPLPPPEGGFPYFIPHLSSGDNSEECVESFLLV